MIADKGNSPRNVARSGSRFQDLNIKKIIVGNIRPWAPTIKQISQGVKDRKVLKLPCYNQAKAFLFTLPPNKSESARGLLLGRRACTSPWKLIPLNLRLVQLTRPPKETLKSGDIRRERKITPWLQVPSLLSPLLPRRFFNQVTQTTKITRVIQVQPSTTNQETENLSDWETTTAEQSTQRRW